jgi:hypothetical protein
MTSHARSSALGHGIGSIQTYIDMDLSEKDGPHPDDSPFGKFLQEVRGSIAQLRLNDQLLGYRGQVRGVYNLRKALTAMLETQSAWEYLCGLIGPDVFYRLASQLDGLPKLVEVLPYTVPPERARRFLADISDCYLLGLDTQCIVTCRPAVEVLVEEMGADLSDRTLGHAIEALRDENKISHAQAEDMFEVNRQAREVIHDEPARRPLSADECVLRVTRLLVQLRPAAWME